MWDSARKCLDVAGKFLNKYPTVPGWRKIRDWYNQMKSMMRTVGKTSSSGGKGKEQRVKQATHAYLRKAKALLDKLEVSKTSFPITDGADLVIMLELERFMELMNKHVDLLERRVIKGEEIPHEENLFNFRGIYRMDY